MININTEKTRIRRNLHILKYRNVLIDIFLFLLIWKAEGSRG